MGKRTFAHGAVAAVCAGLATIALLTAAETSARQSADGQYRQPPKAILDILDAPASAQAALSPDRRWLIVTERDNDDPTIAEVAEPTLMLAGRRVKQNPDGRIENLGIRRIVLTSIDGNTVRTLTPPAGGVFGGAVWVRDSKRGEMAYSVVENGAMSLHAYEAATDKHRLIATPGLQGKIAGLEFSLDGRYLAFTATQGENQALWLADMRAGTARHIVGVNLNHVAGGGCRWTKGQPPLICTATVAGRGERPVADDVPKGPIVQESYGRAAPARTFQDLLKSPHDEALFDYYFTSQIVSVAADGSVMRLGEPAVYMGVDPSPGGEYLLVATAHRPYSYQVPMWQFPRRTAIWDRTGREIKVVLDTPLQDDIPSARDAVQPGVRIIAWRPDVPATLMLVEALDGGDPNKNVPMRDRVSLLAAPFTGMPVKFVDTEMRFDDVDWAFPDMAFVSEKSSRTARTRTWIVNPAKPAAARKLWDLSAEDQYSDPGDFVTVNHPTEPRRIPLRSPDGKYVYLKGQGAAADGARPFVDRLDLATLKTERLWRSAPPNFERAIDVLDARAQRILITRESPTARPNYFLYEVPARKDLRQLTDLPDPAPWFAQVKGELIHYRRADGIELTATLYLPPGYDPQRDGRLPFFFWAYPQEFLTAEGASQNRGSPYEFKRPAKSDHLLLLSQGYGVLDGPTLPIVGKNGGEPNDSYVEQLVAGAKAAIDTIVGRGVADPNRIGVGGHSYGAFMTANLLAHSDLFRAGIARSGAYNRTLTPFGFQAEPRTYWQAAEIYTQMSPFTFANKIDEPLLMIHGTRDSNQGTFPIQSERMFAAIKGNGGNVRYVQLPLEDHGYRARESRRHVLWEMVTWLDKYVKNAGPRERQQKSAAAQ